MFLKRGLFLFLFLFFLVISFISFVVAQEIVTEKTKTTNTNGLILSVDREEWCEWKPDRENDGFKICNSVIEIENTNSADVLVDDFLQRADFQLDKINLIKDRKMEFFWSSDSERILDKDGDERNFWSGWKDFNELSKNSVLANEKIAVRVRYELPQYEEASYNFILNTDSFQAFIDPTISSCGSIGSAGTYTLLNNLSTSGTCFTVFADDVDIDGNGFSILRTGSPGGYGIDARDQDNLTIQNFILIDDDFTRSIDTSGTSSLKKHAGNLTVINTTLKNINADGWDNTVEGGTGGNAGAITTINTFFEGDSFTGVYAEGGDTPGCELSDPFCTEGVLGSWRNC